MNQQFAICNVTRNIHGWMLIWSTKSYLIILQDMSSCSSKHVRCKSGPPKWQLWWFNIFQVIYKNCRFFRSRLLKEKEINWVNWQRKVFSSLHLLRSNKQTKNSVAVEYIDGYKGMVYWLGFNKNMYYHIEAIQLAVFIPRH